ncbi:fumarylacetoacetate hydrolase family protein [Candidatus Galacturonibacter soehngenii]|uniref:Fumarylacetoacetate hydrolase family protein n=1 Tax=Candidatus Galacturonatibacter soehngenii TaxID=2307010 RepID=A0A7V7QLZ4_9FIRM|nr:fumarylacetoacetate hydrolase family protein [Candidatus Galacturonibacter soehngenii]KAB1439478.1 fumarylacetoacetate hydrolase family protein [Candidatus Galacturonibacter soehngenii]
MKLITYKLKESGNEIIGIVSQDGQRIYPISQFDINYPTMNDLIENISSAELELLKSKAEKEHDQFVASDKIIKVAPITQPRQDIICLGINYMAHAEESARYKQEAFGGERPHAVYFSKRVNEAVADGGEIPGYEGLVDSLDYEAELAFIIGKDAKNVKKEDAFDYIFGYTIMNDVSARNLQTAHKQWYFGKSLDGFTPLGPVIVTKDEFDYPPKLDIKSYVNGELRQDSNTELLIFGIAHVVSELSKGMTLKAGTIISMGTPAGVGMGFVPPRFLKKGDVVTCEIEGIGKLTNTIG